MKFDRSVNTREKNCFEGTTIGARQVNSAYHQPVPLVGELGTATSSQLSSTSPSIMVPLGSTEQHGPHLPLDTDTRIATAVARGARAGLEEAWLVAPAIAYGASGEHQDFAGTISIGAEALTMLLVEYGRSAACWAQRLVFVNGHGGNNLDGTPASIRALPAVAAAVGDQVEVLLDGGIRRGSDVVKAVALGARAVMIGRAYLWGLAAAGQAGVENVLDILRGGIDSALMGLGHPSVHDLSPDDILVPDGFARALGMPSA